jgi:hypothetical protein
MARLSGCAGGGNQSAHLVQGRVFSHSRRLVERSVLVDANEIADTDRQLKQWLLSPRLD